MKIYTKVVIDMESLETLYEESYDYEGEMALCGGGSSGSKVKYSQSPEQQEMYDMLQPYMEQAFSQGGWDISEPPDPRNEIPSMQGVISGVPMYNLPSAESLQPTQQWWQGVSPDVKQGLWQPYED